LSNGAFAIAYAREPGDTDLFLEALQLQEECEGLSGLVSLVGSASSAAAEQASWALGRLAEGGAAACDDIVAAGAPEALARALHRHKKAISAWAAVALGELADDGEGVEARRAAIADAGATEALVACVLRAVEDRNVAFISMWALSQLSSGDGEGADARRSAIVAAGAATIVAALSLDEEMAVLAEEALADLASGVKGADARRSALVEAGAAGALVAALRRDDAVVAPAVEAAWALLQGGEGGADARLNAFVDAGAVAPLAALLQKDPCALAAVDVLHCLARGEGGGADARRDAIVESGAIAALVEAAHRGGEQMEARVCFAFIKLSRGDEGVAARCAAITAAGGAALLAYVVDRPETGLAEAAAATLRRLERLALTSKLNAQLDEAKLAKAVTTNAVSAQAREEAALEEAAAAAAAAAATADSLRDLQL
jgi:hypothetical protein